MKFSPQLQAFRSVDPETVARKHVGRSKIPFILNLLSFRESENITKLQGKQMDQ